jgi:hypothetical protein
MAIQVELDAFSGFRNPRWVLEPAREGEFLTLLNALQSQPVEADQAGSKAPPLGYRGFEVRSIEGQELAQPLRVYGGAVWQGHRAYQDAGRVLEKWLLRTASPFVSESVTRAISEELRSKSR